LKESVSAYDPGNPYEKVSTIIPKILALEKVAEIHKVLDENGNMITNSTHPKEYANLLISKLKKCRCCNSFLMPNPEHPEEDSSCISDDCQANPNAEIHCGSCNDIMVRGTWNSDRYNWDCHNDECENSVQAMARERMREQRSNEIFTLIASHFTDVVFADKKGRERYVTLHDGAYMPCPICGEPMTKDGRIVICNAIDTRHASYQIYSIDITWSDLLDSEEPITELPEDTYKFTAYSDESILAEIMARYWLANEPVRPNGDKYVLRDITFYGNRCVDRHTATTLFTHIDYYRKIIADGLPRNEYADEYFRLLGITI